ncbi:MAG: DUF211 domain-containing protein [Sulfolobales archaeon]|nr:DUF211 domain-containing protein [Sulfolobales archaeon]MCX8186547.1 DUF211 domain-containing protein [Sulfolobales archaeon]MDW7970103.1 DUF211 domain-containing protein [Sulfolobales archaeon]
MPLKKVVLDVLKPLKGPSVVEVAQVLSRLEGVSQVVVTVNEIDVETTTLTITIEGSSIEFDAVRESIEGLGGIIHSIDQVVASSS